MRITVLLFAMAFCQGALALESGAQETVDGREGRPQQSGLPNIGGVLGNTRKDCRIEGHMLLFGQATQVIHEFAALVLVFEELERRVHFCQRRPRSCHDRIHRHSICP